MYVCERATLPNPVVHVFISFQHANEDVEKMILGNKCDIDGKRAVSKERGEAVSSEV